MGCAAVDDARERIGDRPRFPVTVFCQSGAETRKPWSVPNSPGLWNDSHWSERMSGAESRNRTDTVLPPPEFESGASTCSAISAI